MAIKETNISNLIRLAVSKIGTKLFRNHVGFIEDSRGTKHRFGLCNGSSDCIGWTRLTVTPDMVGKSVAVFTAIEVKTKRGRASDDQLNFIDAVKNAGGIAGIARSSEEAVDIVKLYIDGEYDLL